MRSIFKASVLAVIIVLGSAAQSWAAKPFVLLELFSSQGCSSCPPADELLAQLTKEAKDKNSRFYPLSFHVDYWDYLGWKDPFSDPEFSKRQYRYAKALKADSAYTPQMIVNGQKAFVGSDGQKARRLIDIYSEIPSSNTLSLTVTRRDQKQIEVSYECDRFNTDDVIHVALLVSGSKTEVMAGENKGLVLNNDHVVVGFNTAPLQRQGTLKMNLPPLDMKGELAVVAYVQNEETMNIYAAEQIVLD